MKFSADGTKEALLCIALLLLAIVAVFEYDAFVNEHVRKEYRLSVVEPVGYDREFQEPTRLIHKRLNPKGVG